MTNSKLLSFQLRPHIAAMLERYVSHVRGKMPEAMQDKITTSLIVRKLLTRQISSPYAFEYVNVGRKRDGQQLNLRVRLSEAEYEAALARAESFGVPYAQLIAALIVDALHPDGNYPPNPDTKPTQQ